MTLYAPGTFTGRYIPSDPATLECGRYVIGHEFAAPIEESDNALLSTAPYIEPLAQEFGQVNVDIARYIAGNFAEMPIYAAQTVAGALGAIAPEIKIAGTFEGTSSNTLASAGGTWSELEQAQKMAGEDWRYPIHVGQAFHAPRIALQALKKEMYPALPPGLPPSFDPQSRQWWCRGPVPWGVREWVGAYALKRRKHL